MTRSIPCIDCDKTMVQETHATVTVDRCPECGGMWFDPGEIQQHLEAIDPRLKVVPVDEELRPSTAGMRQRCPGCAEDALELGAYRGVSFLKCSSCGGTFVEEAQLAYLLKGSAKASLSSFVPMDAVGAFLDFILFLRGQPTVPRAELRSLAKVEALRDLVFSLVAPLWAFRWPED